MTVSKQRNCGDGVSFVRNQYYFGKELTVRDFRAEQDYFNEKRQLINRSIFGWGVVCGLAVRIDPCQRIIVGPGLGLDCRGREVLVSCEADPLDGSKLLEDVNAGSVSPETTWWVCLEYVACEEERVLLPPLCGPVEDSCGREVEEQAYNRLRDSYRLVLRRSCEVKCPPERERGELCDQGGDLDAILRRHVTQPCPDPCECCDCIPLASISVCDQGKALRIDEHSPQRLVYSNPLLKELIACGREDLPRVTAFSWESLCGQAQGVPFCDFRKLVMDGFKVTFDHEMEMSSVNEHSFVIQIVAHEGAGKWLTYRVPAQPMTWGADRRVVTFRPTQGWKEGQLAPECHTVFADSCRVEVVLRGAMIRDKQGRALDGEWLGLPTGNGSAGGDFVSCFVVQPKSK